MNSFIKKITCLSLVLILIGLFYISSAQEFKKQIFNNPNDTSKIYNLLKFAIQLSETSIDSAVPYFQKAEMAAVKIGDKKLIMYCNYEYAYVLFRNGKNNHALNLFQKSLKLAEEIRSDYYIYSSKIYIGTIYLFYANFNLAMEYNLDALKYFESQNNYIALSGIYLNLTYIKYEQNDLEGMKYYTSLSYKYSILAGSKEYECKSLLNYGEYFHEKSDWNTCLTFLKKSLAIAKEINYQSFIATIYSNISEVYYQLNILDSSEYYLEQSLHTEVNPLFIARANNSLCDIYMKKNNLNTALFYARKALKMSSDSGVAQEKGQAYAKLADLYAMKKDFSKAYEYQTLSSAVNDSIFTSDKYRIQNELEAVYQNSKKQKEIDELSKAKEINELKTQRFQYGLLFLGIILFGSVFIGLLLLRQSKFKAKNESIELEQKLLRSQMNPHFIFNSLSAIQDYILNNNALEASSYLSDFAKLMRSILMNSSGEFITLKQEVKTIETYLNLQSIRLNDGFNYKINIDDTIDPDELFVPPMLLQPFIENSIEHGILKNPNGQGDIQIDIYKNHEVLILKAKDNGIGRDASEVNKTSKHESKAINITNQRIKLLSKKFKKNIDFEIIDLKENNIPQGTLVIFKLPLKYNN